MNAVPKRNEEFPEERESIRLGRLERLKQWAANGLDAIMNRLNENDRYGKGQLESTFAAMESMSTEEGKKEENDRRERMFNKLQETSYKKWELVVMGIVSAVGIAVGLNKHQDDDDKRDGEKK